MTYINKKAYIKPTTSQYAITASAMLAASILDSSLDDQTISVTEEEYEGEFCSRQFEWSRSPEE